MNRLLRLACWMAIPAFAQPAPDPLAAKEAIAQKRAADWETLAKGLEGKIARMLPCDQRVRGAIEEVSRASQARLASLLDYLQTAAAQAKADANRASKTASDLDSAAKEADTERTEADQQRAAVEAELADLKESAKRRPTLDEAAAKLAEINAITVARSGQWQQEAGRRVALGGALADLAAAYQARQTAIDGELAALGEETTRWANYYIARLSRAQMECSITNQARPQRKKQ